MLLLVVADGDVGGIVDQDVGGLEDGVSEQADAGAFLILARLVLELGHAVEPAHARGALEDPGELGMGGDGALREQDRLFGVDPAGDQRGGHFADVGAQGGGIAVDGQRVEVGEEEQALGLVLHPLPAQDRAEEVAEVEPAGRLDPRDDAHHSTSVRLARRVRVAIASRSIPPITQATAK